MERQQFNVLSTLAVSEGSSAERIAEDFGYSEEAVRQTIDELKELGLAGVEGVTDKGTEALERYRVKRAVFIAAGFGSRLKPITINTPKPLVRVHGVRIIDRLIDACLRVGIEEIFIVRGYLAEQFDQLRNKYPMIRFIDNNMYTEANNISSAVLAKDLLANAYVFEADLLLKNPVILKKYHYTSDFLAIKKEKSDDWCFRVENDIIVEERVGGEGDDNWQMVGISYWDSADAKKLASDLPEVFMQPEGKNRYWEQVPLVYRKENYQVEVSPCREEDIVEIDTFEELKAIDELYNI